MSHNDRWPDADLDLLRKEWGTLSARAIGRRCSPQRTRQAVIHKARELLLARLPGGHADPAQRAMRRRPKRLPDQRRGAGGLSRLSPPPMPSAPREPLPRIPAREGCQWPLWTDKPDGRSCGEARRDADCPYCPAHAARAYAKAAE